MSVNDFALVQGMRDTRGALGRWSEAPGPVLRGWFAGALAISAALLAAVWVIAGIAIADPTPLALPSLNAPASPATVAHTLFRNSLVLALHATACVAGFIAGSSLPLVTERRTGLSRWVHEKARPVALAWVVGVTCFSLTTQAYVLGSAGASLAAQFQISPGVLVLTVLPHALPELVALFLPLAAWTIASRRNEWRDLLAATVVTVCLAAPILVVSAVWETYVWADLIRAASPVA